MTSQALEDWCRKHGVVTHGIEPALVAEGWRGIVAQRTIQPGDCLMEVPEQLLLSASGSARRDVKLGQLLLQDQHAGLTTQQVLAAHLLHEVSKGAASFWHVYIQALPKSYTCMACFSDDAVAALQLPHAQEAARAAREQWHDDWRGTRPLLQDLGLGPRWRSWAAWRWACATISSRTMYLPQDPTGALTPLGDLHNYRAPPPPFTPELPGVPRTIKTSRDTAAAAAAAAGGGGSAATQAGDGEQVQGQGAGDGSFDAVGKCYKLFARQRYERGDQVFLCYGRHTNLELLETYGFVLDLDNNPHDTAVLQPELLMPVVRPSASAAAVSTPRAVDCYLHADGRPSWQLLQTLRVNAATAAEMKTQGHLALQGQQISIGGDAQCARWLAAACTAQLQSLATTAAEDQVLVDKAETQLSDDSTNKADRESMHLVVHWRLMHKMILSKALHVSTAWLHACTYFFSHTDCS